MFGFMYIRTSEVCFALLFSSWNNLKEVDLVFGTEGNSHFMKKVCTGYMYNYMYIYYNPFTYIQWNLS